MTLQDMKYRVAENLGVLSPDGATIVEGLVTETGIENRLNDVYREELFTLLADKFPDDFIQTTFPTATYTSAGIVDAASVTTTLVTTTPVFDNSMIGFYIENSSDNSKVKITGYTSTTQVTVGSDITDWIGDNIYILGNEFTFGGDVTDIKELLQVSVKYTSSVSSFVVAQQRSYKDLIQYGTEQFTTSQPYFYRTTIKVGGTPKPAVGIFPFPTSFEGEFILKYIQRPPALTLSDEPSLTIPGIAEVIIYGASAWGFRVMKEWEDAKYYQSLYEDYKRRLVGSYKPRSRSGSTKVRFDRWHNSISERWI